MLFDLCSRIYDYNMIKRTCGSVIFVLLLSYTAGCGYHVMGRGGEMIGGIHTISIPFFEDRTGGGDGTSVIRSEISSIITPRFAEELANSSSFRVVSDGEATLKGTIKRYLLKPISFNSRDVVQEYRMNVVIHLSIIKDGESIWDDELSYTEEFEASTDISVFRANEERALKDAAKELAKIFKERVVEDF